MSRVLLGQKACAVGLRVAGSIQTAGTRRYRISSSAMGSSPFATHTPHRSLITTKQRRSLDQSRPVEFRVFNRSIIPNVNFFHYWTVLALEDDSAIWINDNPIRWRDWLWPAVPILLSYV